MTEKQTTDLRSPLYYEHMIVVDVGDGAQLTVPTYETDWQLRYGDPQSVRMPAADAMSSMYFLLMECSKEELWRRVKLVRAAVRGKPNCEMEKSA